MPASVSPHKQDRHPAPVKARIEMLQLAVGGNEGLEVCQLETQRGGVSYTVKTLETVAQQQPEADLFFLMGADTLLDLPQWREPARICELALPVVAQRYGAPPPDWRPLEGLMPKPRLREAQNYTVRMPGVELSSQEIRERVAAGCTIRYWTPRSVETYIQTHRLYQPETPARDTTVP
jgi:nicotinate-nucleotide adenylyltransferase